jgi:hypothetical protein
LTENEEAFPFIFLIKINSENLLFAGAWSTKLPLSQHFIPPKKAASSNFIEMKGNKWIKALDQK